MGGPSRHWPPPDRLIPPPSPGRKNPGPQATDSWSLNAGWQSKGRIGGHVGEKKSFLKLSLPALLKGFIKGNIEDPFQLHGEYMSLERQGLPLCHMDLHLGICDSGPSFLCYS